MVQSKKTKSSVGLSVLGMLTVAAILSAGEAQAQAQRVTDVRIVDVRLQGSGCTNADADVVLTEDRKIMSVLFSNFIVAIGQGTALPQATSMQRECHVLVKLEIPPGLQYAVDSTEFSGFASLSASAYGYHRFALNQPNQMIPSLREKQLRGPYTDNFREEIRQNPNRRTYSRCGERFQTVDLISQVYVGRLPGARDNGAAQISVDSNDALLAPGFKLDWRQCR